MLALGDVEADGLGDGDGLGLGLGDGLGLGLGLGDGLGESDGSAWHVVLAPEPAARRGAVVLA